jgi:hypothetical protein
MRSTLRRVNPKKPLASESEPDTRNSLATAPECESMHPKDGDRRRLQPPPIAPTLLLRRVHWDSQDLSPTVEKSTVEERNMWNGRSRLPRRRV